MSLNPHVMNKRWLYLVGLAVVAAIAVAFVFFPLSTPPDDEAHVEMIAQAFQPPLRFPFEKLPPAPAEITRILEKVNLKSKATTWADYTKLFTQQPLSYGEAQWTAAGEYRRKHPEYYVFGVILLSSAKTRHAFVYGSRQETSDLYTNGSIGNPISPMVWDSKRGWLFDDTLKQTQLASYLSKGTYAVKYFLSQDHESFQRKVPEIKHRYWTELVRHDAPEKVIVDLFRDGTTGIVGDSP